MLNDAQKKHYSLLYPELADDIEKFDIGSVVNGSLNLTPFGVNSAI